MTYARYCIAGNFRGRKLLRIASFYRAKGHHNPKFSRKKPFASIHKTASFAKVFSLKSFPLYYGIIIMINHHSTH